MSEQGALLFARYAYPPNELGYCGPAGAAALLEQSSGRFHDEVRRRAPRFEGAWVYLQILADAVGVADPLDQRVVEAYWVGNELLDRVDPVTFLAELTPRLKGQLGGPWTQAGLSALSNHSFHVFEVYPWVRLLGNGSDTPAEVLDQCRIRCGEVLRVDGERVAVRTRRLEWDGARLVHGEAREEAARWSVEGCALLDEIAAGDVVSLHWDWVCDRLQPASVTWIESLEERQLARTNAWVVSQ
ncbi:MAG: hypothetical protein H0U28_09645 [Nocardioidaceae bacterium]|nr:hypothetical protein [Nocardioidaceae bacterium]